MVNDGQFDVDDEKEEKLGTSVSILLGRIARMDSILAISKGLRKSPRRQESALHVVSLGHKAKQWQWGKGRFTSGLKANMSIKE